MNRVAITFDIDWAPDWAVALCAEICRTNGAAATFFATHPSDVLSDLGRDPNFELGIHPNFQTGSSQGRNFEQVMDYCLEIVPQARCVRTHGLHQSMSLFLQLQKSYPSIETDVSLFLPHHRALAPIFLHLDREIPPLTRIPYFWEDDICATDAHWDWAKAPAIHEGLRVFNFHPIHIALNTRNIDEYHAFKRGLAGRDLKSITQSEVQAFANPTSGARSFLERLVSGPDRQTFQSMSEMSEGARNTDHLRRKT